MIAVFLLLVIAAMVLGILRVVAKGLLLLLFIGDQGSARPANSAPVTLDASV
jgi:hypothetical protein